MIRKHIFQIKYPKYKYMNALHLFPLHDSPWQCCSSETSSETFSCPVATSSKDKHCNFSSASFISSIYSYVGYNKSTHFACNVGICKSTPYHVNMNVAHRLSEIWDNPACVHNFIIFDKSNLIPGSPTVCPQSKPEHSQRRIYTDYNQANHSQTFFLRWHSYIIYLQLDNIEATYFIHVRLYDITMNRTS